MRGWVVLAVALVALPASACRAPTDDGAPMGTRVDYQLGGAYAPADGVTGVVRDRTDPPAPGLWSACYVNAFQTQPGESAFPEDVLLHDAGGDRVEDPDWPGEYLLDIGTPAQRQRVLDVVGPWFDRCAADGFDAVEPDNLDSWTRSQDLLDVDDAVAMARLLVERAHAAGLTIAQKNTAELLGEDLGFDHAVTEECQPFDECDAYTDVFGAAVIEVEYDDAAFDAACTARGGEIAVQRRDVDVTAPDSPDYVSEFCS